MEDNTKVLGVLNKECEYEKDSNVSDDGFRFVGFH